MALTTETLLRDYIRQFDLWVVLAEFTLVWLLRPDRTGVQSISSRLFAGDGFANSKQALVSVDDFYFYFDKSVESCENFLWLYPFNLTQRLIKLKPIFTEYMRHHEDLSWTRIICKIEIANLRNWKQKYFLYKVGQNNNSLVNREHFDFFWLPNLLDRQGILGPESIFICYRLVFLDQLNLFADQPKSIFWIFRLAYSTLYSLSLLVESCLRLQNKLETLSVAETRVMRFFIEHVAYDQESIGKAKAILGQNVFYNSRLAGARKSVYEKLLEQMLENVEASPAGLAKREPAKFDDFTKRDQKFDLWKLIEFIFTYFDSKGELLSSNLYKYQVHQTSKLILENLTQVELMVSDNKVRGLVEVSRLIPS